MILGILWLPQREFFLCNWGGFSYEVAYYTNGDKNQTGAQSEAIWAAILW